MGDISRISHAGNDNADEQAGAFSDDDKHDVQMLSELNITHNYLDNCEF